MSAIFTPPLRAGPGAGDGYWYIFTSAKQRESSPFSAAILPQLLARPAALLVPLLITWKIALTAIYILCWIAVDKFLPNSNYRTRFDTT